MQLGASTTDRFSPAQCRMILALVLLAGFVARVLYFKINCPIGLSGDEAHYWDWSRALDWSYYSKGPSVATLIRFGCTLFGDTEFGVRFPSLLLAIAISLSTYWLTLRISRSDQTALLAVLLCHAMFLFIAGSMLMTIDPPYYLGWGLATCFVHVAIFDSKKWAWVIAGVCIGFSFLAKYAALLWLPCMLIYLVISSDHRKYLKTIYPYLTILVSLLFTIPVIIWNSQHDWVTFGHVSRSTSENQSQFNPLSILTNFSLMVGSQIGILNPLVAILMISAVINAIRSKMHLFVLAMSLPFFGFVAAVTIFKEILPNWPVATYFTLVPLTAIYIRNHWRRTKMTTIAAFIIGLSFIPLMHYTSVFYPLSDKNNIKPRQWDPSFRLHGGETIGNKVSELLQQIGSDALILCEKYQDAGLMAFYVKDHPKTYYFGSYIQDPERRNRLSQYDMWPDRDLSQASLKGKNAVIVGYESDDLVQAFDRFEKLPNLPIIVHGVTIREQRLAIGYGFKGMIRPSDGKTER